MRKPKLIHSLLALVLSLLSACAVTPAAEPSPAPTLAVQAEQPVPTAESRAPQPTATPSPAVCTQQEGRVERFNLPSDFITDGLQFRVYQPPCYGQEPERQYPVLYLIHGQTYTDEQWERLGVFHQADRLIASGEAPAFIIVLPYDKSWAQPREDPFGQALVEELIPFIDSTYQTKASRAYRALGGLSRGAGWAIHLGLVSEQGAALFSTLGMHSPAVFWTDAGRLHYRLPEIPPETLPRIYIDAGDRDFEMESIQSLLDLLTRNRIPHEWHLFTGYHEEEYWRAHVEDYLRWYAAGWR